MSSNTSQYACPKCGNPNSQDLYNGFRHCRECANIFPEELPPTVFHQITASREVLAEKLTYWQYDPDQDRCGWTNNVIVGQLYKKHHEAIAATVARLTEVEN